MKHFGISRVFCLLLCLGLLPLFGPQAAAQVEGTDIILGRSIPMDSKVLGREVNILVYVPDGYDGGTASYPVFYDLNSFIFAYDCGTVALLSRTQNIPEMIVVGVPSFDNGYVPTPFEERGAGPTPADLSVTFLEEELIPFIEGHYRTNPFRVLYGHSVGGLFTMSTMFNHPDLFTAYIAGSPWFQVNGQYWLTNIDKLAANLDLENKFLFMTVGKDEAEITVDTYRELEKWMNGSPLTGLTWKSAWVEGDHSSMVGRNIYDGLLFIFSDWKIPATALRNADVDMLKEYQKKHREKWTVFGFEETAVLPEQMVNAMGYQLLARNETEKAVRMFLYNIERFPSSFNAHDSLAEAYMTMGDTENAVKYYKLAVDLNPGDSEYARRILENSKAKLRELGVEY